MWASLAALAMHAEDFKTAEFCFAELRIVCFCESTELFDLPYYYQVLANYTP